jgi:DNA-binding NtrC family response regulator
MTLLVNVLLVDDEPELVAVLTQRLSRRNFSVTSAPDGEGALSYLSADHAIDVVILDLKMPGIDGIETLKRIRTKLPLVEVIMLTGHSTLDSAVESIRLGAIDYLLKPVEMEKLVSKIEEAAHKKRYRDGLIREVRTTPYLTQRERDERIARILAGSGLFTISKEKP